MSTQTKKTTDSSQLEERKVKALEKIADSLDSLAIWFEEIDKEPWNERLQWYLSLWKDKYIDDK